VRLFYFSSFLFFFFEIYHTRMLFWMTCGRGMFHLRVLPFPLPKVAGESVSPPRSSAVQLICRCLQCLMHRDFDRPRDWPNCFWCKGRMWIYLFAIDSLTRPLNPWPPNSCHFSQRPASLSHLVRPSPKQKARADSPGLQLMFSCLHCYSFPFEFPFSVAPSFGDRRRYKRLSGPVRPFSN